MIKVYLIEKKEAVWINLKKIESIEEYGENDEDCCLIRMTSGKQYGIKMSAKNLLYNMEMHE